MGRIAVYMRCSSHHQNFNLQESEIGEYLEKERNLTLEDTIIFKDKQSGKSSNRPGLLKLKKAVLYNSSEISEVIFYSLDRLSRQGTETVINFLSFLNNRSIKATFIKDQYLNDHCNMTRNILLTVLAEMSRKEGEKISQKVAESIKAYRKKYPNKHWGRPKSVPQDRIIEEYENGLNRNEISKLLDIPYSSVFRTIQKHLEKIHDNSLKTKQAKFKKSSNQKL